jgi:hypothetical protein
MEHAGGIHDCAESAVVPETPAKIYILKPCGPESLIETIDSIKRVSTNQKAGARGLGNEEGPSRCFVRKCAAARCVSQILL